MEGVLFLQNEVSGKTPRRLLGRFFLVWED